MAIEAHETLAAANISDKDTKGGEFVPNGVSISEKYQKEYIKITHVNIENKKGSQTLGKPIGQYTTIETVGTLDEYEEYYEDLCYSCAEEIKHLADPHLKDGDTVLVAGLGNRRITADALGPKVVSSLMITRHLRAYIPEEIDMRIRPVCAISPGVLGTTGIETNEIIKSIASEIKPSLVIIIDALCSGKISRLNSTIQITDTGITPGGGVGNKRKTIDMNSLGIPVIAIGVPTVVDAATIAIEGIETVTDDSIIDNPDDESKIRSVFRGKFGNMIVAPKDVDTVIDGISSIIADGINIAMHRGITLREVRTYK